MTNAHELAHCIEAEQKELYSKVQTEFWHGLFWDILRDHTFQSEFFLVRQDLEYPEVVLYLQNIVNEICQKYGLGVGEISSSKRMEIKVRFHNYGILRTMYDELSIVISKEDIIMRMLPHAQMIKMYTLDEYQLVGKTFQILCEKIFGEKLEDFVAYLEKFKRIEESGKTLTAKTIEIVQNSIRTIYQACDEKFKTLTQRNIYSSMFYKGKTVRILHCDFMTDPNVLISQLR